MTDLTKIDKPFGELDREWMPTEGLDKADLGDRRVILTTPLQYPDHAVLDKCRALGLVYEDGGRYLLEKAFNRKDTLLSQLGNPHNSKN